VSQKAGGCLAASLWPFHQAAGLIMLLACTPHDTAHTQILRLPHSRCLYTFFVSSGRPTCQSFTDTMKMR